MKLSQLCSCALSCKTLLTVLPVLLLVMPDRPVAQSVSETGIGGSGPLEEIVVTGSHVRRSIDSSSPIQVFGRDQIEQVPRSNIAELFTSTTINSGSFFFNDSISQERSSASNIELRGLGAQATLVLLNGRRVVNNSQRNREGNVLVDVNALTPSIMIDRIEVLKDGGSATYGSDAVAGVVNFLTRRDFEGFEVKFDYLVTESQGADDFTFAGIWGGGSEDTHIVAAVDYQDRDPFSMQKRFPERIDQFGLRTPAGLPGTFQRVTPDGTPAGPPLSDPLCGDPRLVDIVGNSGAPGEPAGMPGGPGPCFFNNATGRFIIGAEERLRAMISATHQFARDIELGMEVGFSRTRTTRIGGTFQIGDSVDSGVPIAPASHPFNPFGSDVRLFGVRVLPNATPDPLFIDSDDWRVAFDLSGRFNDKWRWDTAFVYARNDAESELFDSITSRVQLALNGLGGPGCNPVTGTPDTGACQRFNPFGSSVLAEPGAPGSNSPELVGWLLGSSVNDSKSSLLTVDAVVSGEWLDFFGAGPLGLAAGFQYRDETLENDFDSLANAGAFGFLTQSPDFDLDRDIWAAFFEVIVPLHETVELQFAGRYEDYGGGLDTFDPKISALWTPYDNFVARASWGTSFRAPGLLQQGGTITAAARTTGLNTVTGMVETFTPVQRITGNPDLSPEESETISLGFDWEIMPGLNIGLDWWYFEFTDIVVPPSAAAIVATMPFDPRITRDASGAVTELDLTFENAAVLETGGIDFRISGEREFGRLGTLGFDTVTTWTYEYDQQSSPAAPVIDGVGRRNFLIPFSAPTPEWRSNVSVHWQRGPHLARFTTRIVSGIEDDFPGNAAISEDEKYTTLDFLYRFRWDNDLLGGNTTFSAGVNNLFDTAPPVINNDFVTTEVRLYNPRGREFFLGFNKGF